MAQALARSLPSASAVTVRYRILSLVVMAKSRMDMEIGLQLSQQL
jgi:hypothetical protein